MTEANTIKMYYEAYNIKSKGYDTEHKSQERMSIFLHKSYNIFLKFQYDKLA